MDFEVFRVLWNSSEGVTCDRKKKPFLVQLARSPKSSEKQFGVALTIQVAHLFGLLVAQLLRQELPQGPEPLDVAGVLG